MAAGDPPTLPDATALQATNDGLNATGTAAVNSADGLNRYNTAGSQVQATLHNLAQTIGLSVIPAFVTASAAMDKFSAGAGTGRINTYIDQLNEIGEAATRPGIAVKALQEAGGGLLDM